MVSYNKEERVAYEASLKAYRDNYAIAATERQLGFAEGEAKGRAEGKAEGEIKRNLENTRNLKALGVE